MNRSYQTGRPTCTGTDVTTSTSIETSSTSQQEHCISAAVSISQLIPVSLFGRRTIDEEAVRTNTATNTTAEETEVAATVTTTRNAVESRPHLTSVSIFGRRTMDEDARRATTTTNAAAIVTTTTTTAETAAVAESTSSRSSSISHSSNCSNSSISSSSSNDSRNNSSIKIRTPSRGTTTTTAETGASATTAAATASAATTTTSTSTTTTNAETVAAVESSSSCYVRNPSRLNNPSTLLRDWNNFSAAAMSPPVCPAVVLNDEESTPRILPGVVPVATAVSNFFQRSVTELSERISDHIQFASASVVNCDSAEEAGDASAVTLSVRNEGAQIALSTPAAASVPAAAAAASSTAETTQSQSSKSRNELFDSNEYVIVDGDLIVIPAPLRNGCPYDTDEEDEEDEDHNDEDEVDCGYKPKSLFEPKPRCRSQQPLRRSVRGLHKWIKKKAKKIHKIQKAANHEWHSSMQTVTSTESNSDVSAKNDTNTKKSPKSSSPKKKKKKGKKSFVTSWRRSHQDNNSANQQEQDNSNQVPRTPPQSQCQPPQEILMSPIDENIPITDFADPRDTVGVEASFIGNADQLAQLLEAGVIAEAGVIETDTAIASADAYIERNEKDDDGMVASALPRDVDYKADKEDAPDFEYMLRRAAQEAANDLEPSMGDMDQSIGDLSFTDGPMCRARGFPAVKSRSIFAEAPKGKSDGSPCPLSKATSNDKLVHNDIIKVVMVGSATRAKSLLALKIRNSKKKPKPRTTLGVDVHSWEPREEESDKLPVKFSIWDVQGAARDDGSANFGARPGTQSLFFSSKALYLLVWDLAIDNPRTKQPKHMQRSDSFYDEDDEDDDDDFEEEENEFVLEEARRQANIALRADIENRVLSWVDCIERRGPKSAILPVAIIPDGMDESEVKRRCDIMQDMLMHHIQRFNGMGTAPKLLIDNRNNIICVNLTSKMGIAQLQETMVAVASDSGQAVFDHIDTPVPPGTVLIFEVIQRLKKKEGHKLILVDHLMTELGGAIMTMEDVEEALTFLSNIGELFYFGNESDDEILSRYIILSRKWFVSAVSCLLRNDLKQELREVRKFMNLQNFYSHQEFPEHEAINTLITSNNSNCPLLSIVDTNMLWQSMSFMRDAADNSAQLSENNATTSTMFEFLIRILLQSKVLIPLGVSNSIDRSEVFFVPSLLARADPEDLWTFKVKQSWMTTLCHSWLFRDGAPSDLMEQITVSLLRDLYEFSSRKLHTTTLPRASTSDYRSVNQNQTTNNNLRNDNQSDEEAIEYIKIHDIMCWKSSSYIKIGCQFIDRDSGELVESFAEIFVSIQDKDSKYCVASDTMRPSMQRLVVSGKGQAGFQGRKLWKGGYAVVLDSVKSSLADFHNVDRQVVCPACLANSSFRSASTWGWDSVRAAASSGISDVRCIRGHRVNANLLCGTCSKQKDRPALSNEPSIRIAKAVPELLGSVVLVALWDADTNVFINVGSGFIVDKKLGLIVTAGHILFNMERGNSFFGVRYRGYPNAKVVVGVIPDTRESHSNAVFRYFAEIVADNIHSVDAAIIKITTRFETDVDGTALSGNDLKEINLNKPDLMLKQNLQSLKLTSRFELEESVRVMGFNQGGEGVLVQGQHINRSADFAKGYICKNFKVSVSDDSSLDSSESSKQSCSPLEEIVVMCPTISGHSGGPCVNNDGKVVGILSRADPGERQRCYLVPSSELKYLVKQAKTNISP